MSITAVSYTHLDVYKRQLQDIATLTGGTVVSADLGYELKDATVDMLGHARQVKVTKENTTICLLYTSLRHPAVPAHPVLRRRDGLCTLHRQAALRPHRTERDLYHRRRGADGGLPDVCLSLIHI